MMDSHVSVTVTRRFRASAERVFDAWLDPARAGKFLFATPTGRMVRVEIDARVGGSFCFVDRRDGVDVEHVGEYLVIDRPRRLAFTISVPTYSPDSSRVTVEIEPLPDGCQVTLADERVQRDRAIPVEAGWAGILDKLAALASRKEAALSFLRRVAAGQVRDAYRDHVAPGFRHHNPFFRGDAESLMIAMEENAAENPHKQLEVQRALEDGDLVAVHSRLRQKPGDLGAAVVHIFRFEADRVVELWDMGQAVPAESPNEHGMF